MRGGREGRITLVKDCSGKVANEMIEAVVSAPGNGCIRSKMPKRIGTKAQFYIIIPSFTFRTQHIRVRVGGTATCSPSLWPLRAAEG